MRCLASTLMGACLLLPLSVPVLSQSVREIPGQVARPETSDNDPAVRLELGAATNWQTSGGAATFAPSLAGEVTAIEDRLELEAGLSAFITRNSIEWDTDLLFKKPWTLSPRAEFMLGVGPEWVRVLQNGRTADSLAGEVAGDFMFWPAKRRRFGWFLEPAYDYSFARKHEQSIALTAGLLIGLGLKHHHD